VPSAKVPAKRKGDSLVNWPLYAGRKEFNLAYRPGRCACLRISRSSAAAGWCSWGCHLRCFSKAMKTLA